MDKHLKRERRVTIFAVVRVLHPINGVPQFSIQGSNKFPDEITVRIFNGYFTRYCELTEAASNRRPVAVHNSWTPKRRRNEINGDGDSHAELTPTNSEATPVKRLQTP